MGAFKSSRHFPTTVSDLALVVKDVETHFGNRGFDVSGQPTLAGWQIDVSKGGMFKAVLGLQTAMKIEIEPAADGTRAKAGIGIWGRQAIPTAITLFVFWPVLITQMWGIVESSHLDDEAMQVIGQSLAAHATAQPAAVSTESATRSGGKFCTSCGQAVPAAAKYCSECGTGLT